MLLGPSTTKIALILKQGVDFTSDTFLLVDSTGAQVNLAGATGAMVTRATRDASGAALLTFANGSGLTQVTSPASIQYAFTAAQVSGLAPGIYYADYKLTMADGSKWAPLTIAITVEPST